MSVMLEFRPAVSMNSNGRHPDDEPIGQAFFSPEAIKAMSGAQLSVTDLGQGDLRTLFGIYKDL